MLMRMTLLGALGTSLFVAAGCGRLVSRGEYLDTSLSQSWVRADEIQPVRISPVYTPEQRIPREGLILPDLHDPDVDDDDDDVVFARPEYRDRVDYVVEVFRELGELQRMLIEVAALADQKGAPAQAALDPKVRAFLMNSRLIARNALEMRRVSADEWLTRRSQIDTHLKNARAVVREAAETVQNLPARGSFIT